MLSYSKSVAAINNLGDFAHNPRGNLWLNDDSSYGHKLLKKMGWNKGKGLGKNEDGIKENLKVKSRNSNSGLGFKDVPYANIMKTEYESILKNLSAEYSNRNGACLPKESDKRHGKKSKVVKSKMRYSKLFYGKDVSKYSEKDMKSIFICSTPCNDNETQQSQTESSATDKAKSSKEPVDTFSSPLNISDYFTKKMEEKKKKKTYIEDADQQATIESNCSKTDFAPSDKAESSKRKRKHSKTSGNENFSEIQDQCQVALQFESPETDELVVTSHKKSSKKSKRKVSANEIDCFADKDSEGCEIVKPEVSENLGCKRNNSDRNEIWASETAAIDDHSRPKKKRKTKYEFKTENEHISTNITETLTEDAIAPEVELTTLSNKERKKKRKRKKKHDDNLVPLEVQVFKDDKNTNKSSEIVNGCLVSEPVEEETANNTDCLKRKKKKSKKNLKQILKSCLKSKKGSYSFRNVSFNESVAYRIIDTDFESMYPLCDEEDSDQDELCPEPISLGVSNASDDACSVEDISSDELCNNDDSNTEDKQNSDKLCNNDDCSTEDKQKSDELCNNDASSTEDKQTTNELCNNDASSTKDKQNMDELDNNDASNTKAKQNVLVENMDEECTISSLPSPNSPYYNDWIESQRQAFTMDNYTYMLRNIKAHQILGSSNLLCVKGYGNWGF